MSLFKQWNDVAASEDMTQEQYEAFWNEYLPREKDNYEKILENKSNKITGSIKDLAKEFNMDEVTFVGFLDGINTSLNEEINLEELTSESTIDATIDFEKLFFNMHEAQANWLYELPQWDAILSVDTRKNIKKEYNRSKIVVKEVTIGRNDPCTCGSGKKYKKCCGNK